MRRDLIIGIVVSLLIHGGVAWVGQLAKATPKPKRAETIEMVPLMEMPKIEPDEVEVVDEDTEKTVPLDLAPPTQADVPQLITDTSFVQKLQPPPPDNIQIAKNQIVIPQQGTGWAKGIEVFDISKLDQVPVVTFKANAIYPFEMKHAGINGQVIVDFIVDTQGNVRDAYAVSASQHEFEANAVQAVMKWKFKPGRKNGRAVNSRMELPMNFVLNDE